jgi:hypothetical protein
MKKLLLFALPLLMLISTARAQNKEDTTKKAVPLPPQGQGQHTMALVTVDTLYYVILPKSGWEKVVTALRKSTMPSSDIDDIVAFLWYQKKELTPSPAAEPPKK